jgi:aminoglycoside phosphotransferase (APT) family kinase protein
VSPLERTLEAPLLPGSNLKGEVAGANWWFLLPRLVVERVVCLGTPSAATLVNLARMSDEVVVSAPRRWTKGIGQAAARLELPNVSVVESDGNGRGGAAHASGDVVLRAGRAFGRSRRRQTEDEIERLLRPDGIAYLEFRPVLERLMATGASERPMEQLGSVQLLWLAPVAGEIRLAAPLGDHRTIAYLERRYLRNAFLRRDLIRHPRRFLGRHVIASRLMPRRGVLAGLPRADLDVGPPRYVQSLAAQAGVPLQGHRWGFAAIGEYSSQKVLFFLFRGEDEAPQYVVKITRDPSLSPRLENERRALGLLGETDFGAASALPRPVFFGYERGLAVLGETAIDGVPFKQRTTGTVDCPFARAALDWLVELGITTASRPAGGARDVADELEALFQRFRKIYRLSRAHEAFLGAQIEALASSENGFPLVFQHGDPGPWNLLITAAGEPAFLDWEAAEPSGMPLWDLFHFLRSYGLRVSQAAGTQDPMRSFEQQFLDDSLLGRLLARTTSRYCAETGLPREFVQPLFYVCWVHRALREVTRLPPDGVNRGRYVNLLRLSIERRESPGLRRIFSLD